MRINLGYVTILQYKVKVLQAQVEAYESGEAYRQKEVYEKRLREKDLIIASLKKELAQSHGKPSLCATNGWRYLRIQRRNTGKPCPKNSRKKPGWRSA